ncbi:hypothetical protein K0504_11440 [Neiella marina]|uniref:Twin-arginine translocation signal domain-containing protein n=1 Tax=Neiella holothuriorum TaxID=2870530 RepID=A0ABS7EH39_9GAMM|nr:hypothetical protein [Neiella holothuriorum]MBW8191652.1 hypothetical protein [Neiella holothuriorum]
MSNEQSNDMEVKEAKSGAQSSRFDRRRFLRTSAAATPVLMTLKSPTAWATQSGACSLTVVMSGNSSNPNNCTSACPFSPGYWHKVLEDTNNGQGGASKQEVRSVIMAYKNPFRSNFNDVFLANIGFPQYDGDWKCTLSEDSDNPTFDAVLPSNGKSRYSLKVKFENINESSSCYKDEHIVDLTNSKNNVQKFLVAAVFNSLFSPTYINYRYQEPDEVIAQFTSATNSIIDDIFTKLSTHCNDTSTSVSVSSSRGRLSGKDNNNHGHDNDGGCDNSDGLISGHPYLNLLTLVNEWDTCTP